METKSLDDILNEGVQEEVPAELPAEEQGEQVETVARDEKGRFAPKGVEESAPPAPDKLPPDEFAALKDERRKRQDLERQLQEMQQAIQAANNPPPPPPDIWENTQEWQEHLTGQVVTQAVQQASLNATIKMSEMLVRQAHPDFDEVKAAFVELAQQNPVLAEQALADPHPWQKAYQIAKTHKTMAELGATDISALEEKIRQQVLAEMAAGKVQTGTVPPSLVGERNVGSRTGPAWSGPTPLSELLR